MSRPGLAAVAGPARAALAASLLLLPRLALPSAADAQSLGDRDARLPAPGDVWFEAAPTFESWSSEFDAGGSSTPIAARYDGSVVGRLFPGPGPLLADLNRDAGALGFDSLGAADLSLGTLAFGAIQAERRRVPFSVQVGVLDRLALQLTVPLVWARAEPTFLFDGAAATHAPASGAIDAAGFVSGLATGRSQLQTIVDAGGLAPEEDAAARALIEQAAAFEQAYGARVQDDGFLPIAGSSPGAQVAGRYGSLADGFSGFGVNLPALTLPDSLRASGFQRLLTEPPLAGDTLRATNRGWGLGEIEVGLRFKLLDSFTPVHVADPAAWRRDRRPDLRGTGLQARTSIGVRLRLGASSPDVAPWRVPTSFLQVPIGDGSTDVELELLQDLQVGARFHVTGGLRWILQTPDDLRLRVHDPERPFAYASQERSVRRDLGNVLELVVSPRLRMNATMAVGLEYGYRSKGADVYAGDGTPDPTPLEIGTTERRHRLGVGLWYRTTPMVGAGLAGFPVEIAFLWSTSIAGSGGTTPDSNLLTASFRVPVHLF